MFREEEPDPELDIEELSPLLQMIAPKIICCRIHEYQPEDFEACLDIHRSNQPDSPRPGGLKEFAEFLDLGTTYFLVIEHEGETVACGGLELVGDSDSATLVHLMVHGDYQRRGYGSTLLTACIALLDQEDRPLDLWVNTAREAAFFYRQYGFRQHPVSPDSPLFDRDARHGEDVDVEKRELADRHRAALWLSVNPQDIEDARAILEERSIRIELEDAADVAEADAEAEEEEI